MTESAEIVLKVVPLVGAGASWLYSMRVTTLRGKIKTDFELLKMSREAFGPEHEISLRIQAKLDRTIPYLYRKEGERKGSIRWEDFALGCFCILAAGTFAVFGFDAVNLYQILHFVAAAFLAFIAFGAFLNAFSKGRIPR